MPETGYSLGELDRHVEFGHRQYSSQRRRHLKVLVNVEQFKYRTIWLLPIKGCANIRIERRK